MKRITITNRHTFEEVLLSTVAQNIALDLGKDWGGELDLLERIALDLGEGTLDGQAVHDLVDRLFPKLHKAERESLTQSVRWHLCAANRFEVQGEEE